MKNFRKPTGNKAITQSQQTINLQIIKQSTVILGIDPGTILMGYGLIAVRPREIQLLEMDVLKLAKFPDPYERLQLIHLKVSELIRLYQPSSFAIEAPFFGKNVQSMLKLGRAQGVAIAAAMHTGIPVTEYSPKKIKQAITGNGNAAKEQVWQMLQRILHFQEKPRYFDATDALAAAVCHHFQQQSPQLKTAKKLKDWKDFMEKNPDKVIVKAAVR